MNFFTQKYLLILFFLSGVAGLIYEIAWTRQLVLIFGSTTNSIVAVISAFLGGLAIGSLIFGKISDKIRPENLIKTYANLEIAVGITASFTLILIPATKNFYTLFSDGVSTHFGLLALKFFLAILIIAVPTTLMGATLPVLSRFIMLQKKSLETSVSHLYAVNTFGSVLGTLISAFFLIELVGLNYTVLIAVFLNLLIGLFARFFLKVELPSKNNAIEFGFTNLLTVQNVLLISIFSLSGLVSIAYEVLWTRILTPTVGTFVYAFAAILALYLTGIAFGSLIYEKLANQIKSKALLFAICQFGIGFFALGSVYLTSNQISLPKDLTVFAVILPSTIFMGLTFPAAVSLISKKHHSGKTVGLLYFGNTLGSITGGFLASFFFLPHVGSSQSILFLSVVNFALALFVIIIWKKSVYILEKAFIFLTLLVFLFTSWLFLAKRYSLFENTTQWRINWAKANGIDYEFKEDEVASVFAYHDFKKDDYNLFIDGVPTTGKIGETKLMAHYPIALHPNPQKMLIIAFGMGTTFRSSLSHGISTDNVELVPSVPTMMHFFHPDAREVLKNPKGRVIINDGRNYIFLTREKYDIVTIDPPPPFNAAGTTVLYSKNFYQEIAAKLNPDGIVSQWMWFGSREDDISMTTKSFIDVFPYVLVMEAPRGSGGVYLEGSLSPLAFNNQRLEEVANNKEATADLEEAYPKILPWAKFPDQIIGDRNALEVIVGNYKNITDENPRTEYFLLRHFFTKSPSLTATEDSKFIQKIKAVYQNSSKTSKL